MLVSVDGLESGQVMYRKTIASFSKNFGGFYDAPRWTRRCWLFVGEDALVRYYKSLPADYLPLCSGVRKFVEAGRGGEREVGNDTGRCDLLQRIKTSKKETELDVDKQVVEAVRVVMGQTLESVMVLLAGLDVQASLKAGELVTVQEVEVVMTLVVKQHARLVVHLDAVAVLEQVVVGEREHGVDVEIQKVASVMEAVKGQEQEQEIIVM
ncbi:hypothetical protein PC116_g19858 [Phytophthora cactorum]|uniref:Uncharacterized protein n=1 Tax=Phytophthora cactorum TaxID=29920 RepID=A0A8T1C2I1_9STRA|nr:hypothetical protein PC112_g17611 [Phytophthora cactorum]KAG2812596.1 hypothetical protein PC111_g14743 [Phytophthora cactorum]KAG2852964.1 hypothetical protein PC113_g14575 [Phytophthora cactorum]KAG2886228.1 hypothetical protein PC114_g19369 [Phytophthora cactorum]KAG2897854.1 hypothetical protein PC115_g17025 [Phytophthora cactorum]